MARMGTFTRGKSGSNITSQVEALYQAQQNAEWTAINDAWKNGGSYDFGKGDLAKALGVEGKGLVKITDELILAYMTSRRDEVKDQTDPVWAQWNNNVLQQRFSIDSSKINVSFKEGKTSASGVAAFYRSQLSKFDPNSEIYRTIEAAAADWSKSAAAAGAGAARQRAMDALQAKFDANATTRSSFEQMDADLRLAAQKAGLLTSDKQDIGDIRNTADWQRMLAAGITVNGRTYTMTDWNNGLHAYVASLDSDVATYNQAKKGSTASQISTINDDIAKIAKAKGDFNEQYIQPTNTLDIETQYQYARKAFDDAMENADNDPQLEAAAQARYKADLTGLISKADAAGDSVSPYLAAGLRNDLNAQNGNNTGPTWDDHLNAGPGGTLNSTDADTQAKNYADTADKLQAIADGKAVYGQTGPGSSFGLVDVEKIITYGPDGPHLPDYYEVAQRPDGTTVYYAGEAVNQLVDQNGKPLTPDQIKGMGGYAAALANKSVTTQIIGYIYRDGAGNPVTYATVGPKGAKTFTNTDPFGAQTPIPTSGGAMQVATGAAKINTSNAGTGADIVGSVTFNPYNVGSQAEQDATASRWAGATGAIERINAPARYGGPGGETTSLPKPPAPSLGPSLPIQIARSGGPGGETSSYAPIRYGGPGGETISGLPAPTITLPSLPAAPTPTSASTLPEPKIDLPKPPAGSGAFSGGSSRGLV